MGKASVRLSAVTTSDAPGDDGSAAAEPGRRNRHNTATKVIMLIEALAAREEGIGVISMKLAGEGTFDREDRRKAMRFAFRNAGVDCVTVGYKSPAEIDEAIENLNLALA